MPDPVISYSDLGQEQIRDDVWLLSRLDYLWSNYFADVEQANRVFIQFGRFAQFRLGSIRLDPSTGHTQITITSMFKDSTIPAEVVDHTIAHELSHYAHGFSSPLKRKYKHPHKGGVVNKEITSRGLEHLITSYKSWLKEYRKQFRLQPRRTSRRVRIVYRSTSLPFLSISKRR